MDDPDSDIIIRFHDNEITFEQSCMLLEQRRRWRRWTQKMGLLFLAAQLVGSIALVVYLVIKHWR